MSLSSATCGWRLLLREFSKRKVLGNVRSGSVFDLIILEIEITEEAGPSSLTGSVSSSAISEAGHSGEKAVPQCTCPAVAVLGGTSVAAQNVAGPPQHALQPVAAAPLPLSSDYIATGSKQHKGDSKAAHTEQTITDAQQNSGTKKPEELSTLCHKETVSRGLVSASAKELQKLSKTLGGQTFSDRLFESRTTIIAKKQDSLYGCNTEKISLAHRETDMAEGSSTGLCQDWSKQLGDAGDVSVANETEKGPLPPETIKLEYKPDISLEKMPGKHTPGESPCIPTTQVIPAVSSTVKTTDRDMHQTSFEFSVPQEQSTTNSAMACKLDDSKETMEDVPKGLPKTKEGGICPAKKTSEGTQQGFSGNSLCSGYSSSKQGGPYSAQHITPDNGNNLPIDSNEGYPPEDCSKIKQGSELVSTTKRTTLLNASPQFKSPNLPTLHENMKSAQELSSQQINLSGIPKTFHLGKETGAREGEGNDNLPVHGDLCSNLVAKDVFHDISVDVPKQSVDGTCTNNVQIPIVNEGSHIMVCGLSDMILKPNDSAKWIEISMSSNHQQDGGIPLAHAENFVTLESLESDQSSPSQATIDCVVQQVQESIPADNKLSQIQRCLNDTPGIVNVEERQESAAALSEINAVEMKDLTDVGILMQPEMEDTWLVVSEIDRQCEGTEPRAESLVQCPESQSTVAVYECNMPCFTTTAVHGDFKLLLPEKVEEELAVKQVPDPMETLTQEFTPQFSQAQSNLDSQTSSNPNSLKPTQELPTMPTIIIKENEDSSPNNLVNTVTEFTPSLIDNTLDSVPQESVVVVENTPGVSLISLSCDTIDPKLLILRKGDNPFLKPPPSLSARISTTQNSPVQAATPSNGSHKASECLAKTNSTADSLHDFTSTIKADATLPAKHPVSNILSQSSRTVPTSNVLSKNSSVKENLSKSNCSQWSDKMLQNESSANTSLLIVQLHNSQSRLSSSGDECGTVSSVDPEGNMTEQSPANTPCQDSTSLGGELELEQQQSPDEHLSTTQDAQHAVLEPLEESSDGEVDSSMEIQNDDSNAMSSPAPNKVCQWIAGKVTAGSTPSTSPVPCPSPSPSSSDWIRSHSDGVSPVPSSKNTPSTSSQGSGGCSQSEQTTTPKSRSEKHTDMAELAKHEAEIEHRTLALKRDGFWSLKRLSRLTEPVRPKVQWDYLCEEMQWLSADFAQERRWKRGVARKVVRMVMRHHEELRQKEERAKREEQSKLRRVASSIAKEVRAFWSSVEKVVQYKQQSRLEEKRKKALDLQLDFIVGQTERYSDLLSQSLQAAPVHSSENAAVTEQSQLSAVEEDDRDFEPPCEEEDDEETIEVEEQQEGNDAETQRREIELLRQEGTLPLDQLLSTLTLPQDVDLKEEASDTSFSTVEDEDKEFCANEEDAEDEEDTIAAQENIEGDGDHAEELDDLAREGEMSMEELLEKYRGAYASDVEEPSASPESSDESEGTEEEVDEETDGEDSIDESCSSDSQAAVVSDEEEENEVQESDEDDDNGGEGMEVLLREGDHSPTVTTSPRPKKEISHIAATAESLQPKGYTLATTKVKTPIPFLLYGTLREYQHIGLDWLVTMNEKKLNGILADEMGLGKTIQTIALLAHLACVKGNWGPHLIIVPTSVMLNWEMELKRWCPGFKILTYYGSQKERKLKRQGWTKPNAFHVCITSYKLVLQDHQAFRRKAWRYLILDEAQNIKNFKSQRWQSLLNFNSQRRLLLTGTPLQNSLMELWSLMHFLMPHVFQSHREFKEWFSNPLTGMIEGSQEYNEGLVKRLHKVLRPFLLRRIKVDVEKQMPKKYEHVVRCRLSKRQRFLYDDFMAQASTRETLASGHFMSVINILMQLRKVCNHPNLFDPRPIQSPFITKPIIYSTASLVQEALETSPFERCDLSLFDLVGLERRVSRYQADVFLPQRKVTHQLIQEIMDSPDPPPRPKPVRMKVNRMLQPLPKSDGRSTVNSPWPSCPTTTAVQTPKPPLITEVTTSQAPSQPSPQVCPVTPVTALRAPVGPSTVPASAAIRPPAPHPVTIRPSAPSSITAVATTPQPASNLMTQRVLLSPDMQARLPSGEVVSIAQLASLAGRPVSSCQGSKPVTFQLQGNKLTLSGTQLHQVPVPQPRPIQGNVMHLVSSSGQHHLISQSAQVAVLHTVSQSGSSSAIPHPASTTPSCSGIAVPFTATQVPSSMVSGPGIVKIVVRQAASKEGGSVPTLAVPPSPRPAPPQSVTLRPHGTPSPVLRSPTSQPPQRPPVYAAPPRTVASSQTPPTRPVLRVVQGPATKTEPVSKVNSSSGHEDRGSDVITLCMSTPKPASTPQSSGSPSQRPRIQPPPPPLSPFYMSWLADSRKAQRDSRISQIIRINELHCSAKPVYGREVLDFLTFIPGPCQSPARPVLDNWTYCGYSSCLTAQSHHHKDYLEKSEVLKEAIHNSDERLKHLSEVMDRFTFIIPPVEAKPITMHSCHPPPSLRHQQTVFSSFLSSHLSPLTHTLHRIQCNMRTHFPDLRLIQYDCGKLQTLHLLLRKLKAGGHRVLIFTQMTRMLDILEQFLNYHGHIYLRLDGSTRVEQRQALMERFNADRRIFCFILSTRSGGVGVNLTGADTVVFYDSDWNPTMDAQAQDRCHRIGQTRDVHIYRLISERTVEENILKKANQKRMLGDMAIEGGNFTTAFFKEQTIRELFDLSDGERKEAELSVPQSDDDESINKQQTTILEQALCRAEDEEDIVAASQAKAEQVAELAEFNENIPLDDGDSRDQEEEELSKAEQEIAALVEQLTPIERYAMNFLEASLEDICKEELKQAEEQVEAARKGLDQAKEEGLKLHQSSDSEEEDSITPSNEEPTPSRRPRKHKEKGAPSTRVSGRLRGAPADEMSLAQPSPDRERGKKGPWVNSEDSMNETPGLSSAHMSLLEREVPEKLRCGLRGRGATKESVSPTTSVNQKVQTNQQLSDSATLSPAMQVSDPKICVPPSPLLPVSPSSSVPSASLSTAMDRNSSGHQSSLSAACRDDSEEHGGEALSDTAQYSRGDRRISASSDSICSPEHQSEQDGQLSLSPTLASPSSRLGRKRQSAESEILRSLPEDSPSAKVLRKLPGRLVTVVEEKEPKRRKRGVSGSGGAHTEGSSEEIEQPEAVTDPGSHSYDGASQNVKDSPPKTIPTSLASSPTPQDQEQVSSPSPSSTGRGHHPCFPTHHSPDMPVLRNLPVRRRLETESRMAAQLGEQFVGRGRGVDKRSALSPKKQENNLDKDSVASTTVQSDSNVINPIPVKRKRGRPPKTPPMAPELPDQNITITQKTSPEQSPPHSPKRKRGRPRKDSTSSIAATCSAEEPLDTVTSSSPTSSFTSAPSQEPNLSTSNVIPAILPTDIKALPISSPTVNPTSPSKAAELSSPQLDSQTNQSTTCVLLSCVHRDSQNNAQCTSELSHSDTYTSLRPITACTDSQTSTVKTPHSTSTASVSQASTASSHTLQLPSPHQEPSANIVPNHAQQHTLTTVSVHSLTNKIPAPSEILTISGADVEVEQNSFAANQRMGHLQHSNTSTQVSSKSLEVTNMTADSTQASIESICNTAVSSAASHQTSTQPIPVHALTSETDPESSSFKTVVPEPSVKPTVSMVVQQSTPKPDQTSVPPSQPQTTLIQTAKYSTHSSLTSHKKPSNFVKSPSAPNQTTTDSLPKSHYRNADSSQPQNMPMKNVTDSHEGQKEEVVTEEMNCICEDDAGKKDILCQPKRRKMDVSSVSAIEIHVAPKTDEPDKPSEEDSPREDKETRTLAKKQSISRQSSQESVCSSSPSSVSSCGTRSSRSKKAGEVMTPAKRKQEDINSGNEKTVKGSAQKHQSNSSSSSSDSEDSSRNRCLTRSAQKKLEKDVRITKNNESKRQKVRSDMKGQTTNTTELDSSGETNSRVTRKSTVPQSVSQSSTLTSPETEVLGKRCSALNAAAKLVAMRGRGPDTPNPSPKIKATGQQSRPLLSEKSSKPKSNTGQDSPKTCNSKTESGRQTPNQSSEIPQSSSAARSTRQRPGSLVPPLETERVKKEEKKKRSDLKEEGDDENRETRSSRGHSACSSVSTERGAGSSRSRSSSNSSQRTYSLSSQSTEPSRSRSRAPSSGSDTERAKSIRGKNGRGRESRREKRSQKHDKTELSAGSSDGTPDRVLRSVAALAAAQARTPASNTRSSSSQHRHSKT
ncbi:helicase SRCAP-like [Xyrauchen texanus]|uniref:helicase SRCAP-like n=1 Tax=Xyrauchen texanus TaxID=154827 RepID=UPI0022425A64|nr:helicase SRCAP-like [Xyrauchen texanus]